MRREEEPTDDWKSVEHDVEAMGDDAMQIDAENEDIVPPSTALLPEIIELD